MARGRFITNGITSDKKINDLSDDTSRLAFTWLITFADCEGRTHGDPAMVRSMLFPRRTDVTIERMETYLAEWQAAGLVRIYTANGDTWLDFPNFGKHQTGLRKDHEAASIIVPFEDGMTTELLRNKDVVETPQIKLREEKIKISEGKVGADKPRTPPQILAYREVAQKYPKKALWTDICDVVKDDEKSLEFFKQVIKAAISIGWYEGNIANLLEWVKRGELPHKNGSSNGNGSGTTRPTMFDVIREAQKDPNYNKE